MHLFTLFWGPNLILLTLGPTSKTKVRSIASFSEIPISHNFFLSHVLSLSFSRILTHSSTLVLSHIHLYTCTHTPPLMHNVHCLSVMLCLCHQKISWQLICDVNYRSVTIWPTWCCQGCVVQSSEWQLKLAFETAAFSFDKFSLGPKVIAPTLYTERPWYVSSLRACVLILLVSK